MLIGADGLHSVIRKALHGETKTRYAGYTCWRGVAKYDGTALPRDTAFEAWGPGQRFAAHHLGGGQVIDDETGEILYTVLRRRLTGHMNLEQAKWRPASHLFQIVDLHARLRIDTEARSEIQGGALTPGASSPT